MNQRTEHFAGFGELRSAVHRQDWEGLGRLDLNASPEVLAYLHEVLGRHPTEDVSCALEWTRWSQVYEGSQVGCGPVDDARVDETLEMLHRGVHLAGVELMRVDPAEYARLTLGWSMMSLRAMLELYDRWCHATHPEDVGRFGALADAIEEYIAHPYMARHAQRTSVIMGARVKRWDAKIAPHALLAYCLEHACYILVHRTLGRAWDEAHGQWNPMHNWLCGFVDECCLIEAVFEHVSAKHHAPEPHVQDQDACALGSRVLGPWDPRNHPDELEAHIQWRDNALKQRRGAWVRSWNAHVLAWWRQHHTSLTTPPRPVTSPTPRFTGSWGFGRPPGTSPWNMGTPGRGVVLGRDEHGELVFEDNHVFVVGPARSFKTSGVVIPTVLGWQGSRLVVTPRLEVDALVYESVPEHGQAVFLAPGTTDNTTRYNPLEALRGGARAFDDAEAVLNPLLHTLEDFSQVSDWDDLREALVCLLVYVAHLEDPATLSSYLGWVKDFWASVGLMCTPSHIGDPIVRERVVCAGRACLEVDEGRRPAFDRVLGYVVRYALADVSRVPGAWASDASDFCLEDILDPRCHISLVTRGDRPLGGKEYFLSQVLLNQAACRLREAGARDLDDSPHVLLVVEHLERLWGCDGVHELLGHLDEPTAARLVVTIDPNSVSRWQHRLGGCGEGRGKTTLLIARPDSPDAARRLVHLMSIRAGTSWSPGVHAIHELTTLEEGVFLVSRWDEPPFLINAAPYFLGEV